MTKRAVAAVAVGVAAVTAMVAGFLPLHAAYVLAGQEWFAWLDTVGLEGLALGTVVVLLAGYRSWAAWALVVASVPVNVAAALMPTWPWMAAVVAPWPIVAVCLGCLISIRGAMTLERAR